MPYTWLECAKAGNWSNDPVRDRGCAAHIAMLQPGARYSQSEVIDAFKEAEPDFQRPTGDYDTWHPPDGYAGISQGF